MIDLRVEGLCPMGCGRTLIFGDGGRIKCTDGTCPNPFSVADLLANTETEHIVVLDEEDFSVQHPLHERLDGDLFLCDLHRLIASHHEAPMPPGRYRVCFNGDDSVTWGEAP